MNIQQISYSELATLPKAGQQIAAFQAVLSVIPENGCRMFVNLEQRCLSVVDDDGKPMFFPSVEFALPHLAMLPGIDHQVIVDLISLLPRGMVTNRILDGTEQVISRLMEKSRAAANSSVPT